MQSPGCHSRCHWAAPKHALQRPCQQDCYCSPTCGIALRPVAPQQLEGNELSGGEKQVVLLVLRAEHRLLPEVLQVGWVRGRVGGLAGEQLGLPRRGRALWRHSVGKACLQCMVAGTTTRTCGGGPGKPRRGKNPTSACWLACHLANARSTSAHLQGGREGSGKFGCPCSLQNAKGSQQRSSQPQLCCHTAQSGAPQQQVVI